MAARCASRMVLEAINPNIPPRMISIALPLMAVMVWIMAATIMATSSDAQALPSLISLAATVKTSIRNTVTIVAMLLSRDERVAPGSGTIRMKATVKKMSAQTT
ncbi:hypothetical protein OUZ56_003285 [Daphnia magna]|uniref:Uncharacterized protein n=1 Tax=Daphnia magna TaxID=35525 RepID=A0ABR0A8K8_9CRUS|nr:hypothetical protein OUZ56_003285 [Daphnia magna]